ncbi:MAG: succinate dehydrogenase cytochrome b subunit [Acidobacteriota bacterium]
MSVGTAASPAAGAKSATDTGKLLLFYQSPVGKKAVMAVTGLIGFGFVIGHMLGNLQIFLGPEVMNAYGLKLHETPALLYGARIVLSLAVLLHIIAAVQLINMNRKARPDGYAKLSPIASSYAARTMRWSGPMLAAFIIYHLLHFTIGIAHPHFVYQDAMRTIPSPYENAVRGFSNPVVAGVYIVAMILLMLHINHGAWSLFQSLGLNHPRYTPMLRTLARAASMALLIGNCSIPIAVLAGVVK